MAKTKENVIDAPVDQYQQPAYPPTYSDAPNEPAANPGNTAKSDGLADTNVPSEFPAGLEVIGVSNGTPLTDGLTFALDCGCHYEPARTTVNGVVLEPGFRWDTPVVRIDGYLNEAGVLDQPDPTKRQITFHSDQWHQPGLPLVRALPGYRIVRDMRLKAYVLLRELDNLEK